MDRLRAALEDSPTDPLRSSLYEWLWEHRTSFAALVNGRRLGSAGWDKLAQIAAEGDPQADPPMPPLTDGHGKPPTGITMRQTWWKVRRADAAQRAVRAEKRGQQASAKPPKVAVQAVPAPSPAPSPRPAPTSSSKPEAAPSGSGRMARLMESLAERSGRTKPKT